MAADGFINVASKLDREKVWREFRELVNMPAAAIEKWLATTESQSVGWKEHPDFESVGHASGRYIVKILKSKKDNLTELDYAHMRKVVGYIKRHSAQPPKKDPTNSRWRYSLMNWGHDPME
jgi:hypothetical protein